MYTKVMTSQEKPAKILAFVGLPGAGKTEATNFVAAKGFPKIYGGGILYDEMRARGVEITPESQAEFRKQWRERDGKDVIVRRAAEQLHRLIDAGQHRLLFDGLYSWTEYKFLKHEFPGELIVAPLSRQNIYATAVSQLVPSGHSLPNKLTSATGQRLKISKKADQ